MPSAVDAIVPVILCGGSGTRLWPLSREEYPKQFLGLLSERSLFQETVLRAHILNSNRAPLIVGNETHRFLMRGEIEELGIEEAEIILESEGRNTAPALALAALHVAQSYPEALLLALPADHTIEDSGNFVETVQRGVPAAAAGEVVVFGVRPTEPHTGYGYIRKGALRQGNSTDNIFQVAEFAEKPDSERAREYLETGHYFWNSGIFLVRADRYLDELAQHAPDILSVCRQAFAEMQRDGVFLRPGREAFLGCRSESIDYAVMEHTRRAVMVEFTSGWSDLGSWASLIKAGASDPDGNVQRGDVLLHDVKGSLVHSSGRLVTAIGLRDHVVVETPDAVFVAPADRAEEVKTLVTALKASGRSEARSHRRVYRPWGWYEGLTTGERMQVKRIQVNPGASLSLQLHHHRAEHWVVVHGEAQVTRGDEVFVLHANESTYIPVETKHRLHNTGVQPLEIIEVQCGDYLGEDDIVRFDDQYGRVSPV